MALRPVLYIPRRQKGSGPKASVGVDMGKVLFGFLAQECQVEQLRVSKKLVEQKDVVHQDAAISSKVIAQWALSVSMLSSRILALTGSIFVPLHHFSMHILNDGQRLAA